MNRRNRGRALCCGDGLNDVVDVYRSKGLGRQLLTEAESMLVDAGHAELELHARVDNVAAVAFYEKAGWVVTDQVIRTVEHGISYDEHVLAKHHS